MEDAPPEPVQANRPHLVQLIVFAYFAAVVLGAAIGAVLAAGSFVAHCAWALGGALAVMIVLWFVAMVINVVRAARRVSGR